MKLQKKLLIFIISLYFTTPSFLFSNVPVYPDIPEPSIDAALQSMRAHAIQYTNFLFYTLNMDTPGFIEQGSFNLLTKDGVIIVEPFYRWRTGAPVETNRELDVYLDADTYGFFSIQMPNGKVAYTRDGRFEIDSLRRLVTLQHSFPVLGDTGPIFIPEGAEGSITFSASGIVYVSGDPVDKLRVVVLTAECRNRLIAVNGSIFSLSGDLITRENPKYTIRQWYIEQNSVLKSIVGDVAMAKHPYEASSKVARSITKTLTSAVQMANP
jgi:flagellar basal body rod protein FlgG